MEEAIIDFVENNSYFQVDDEEHLSFTTRKHGNIAEEQHSDIDYLEAIKICQKVKKEFEHIEYDIDTCDEWVNIYISITDERD